MAIYTGRMRQDYEREKEAKRLATVAREQEAKAQKRAGWSGLLGQVAGAGLGALAIGATGITGGLAAPLMGAATGFLGKKFAHEATKGMGADPSKIKSESKYGYGVEEAKTLREGLRQQMAVDPMKERGGFGKDLLSSYLSAGLSGSLTGSAKTLLSGDKGSIAQALTGQKDWAGSMAAGDIGGWKGAMSAIGLGQSELSAEDVIDAPEYTGLPFEQEGVYSPLHPQGQQPYVFGSEYVPEIGQSYETSSPSGMQMLEEAEGLFAEGGQVPTKDQLIALLMASKMRQPKAYDDTPLEEIHLTYDDTPSQEIQPTIAEYFNSEGKTLGGNNTQSLSQMLGRS